MNFTFCPLKMGCYGDSKGAYPQTESSRVESSPIQSSWTHKDAAVTLWLTYNGRRGSAYTPAESSPMSLAESSVLMPKVSFSSVRRQ